MPAANQSQWVDLWRRLGASGDGASQWQLLQQAYSESWRAYHNLTHIGHCLAELGAVQDHAHDALALEAAIWFHDVIYDTHAKDNEERSADLAVATLNFTAPRLHQQVRNLILATKHNHEPKGHDARLMVDIDLAILGQSPERYARFEEEIRREFDWVSPRDFAVGRTAVLDGFLKRKSIFTSESFAQRYEAQARKNLGWAIARLAPAA